MINSNLSGIENIYNENKVNHKIVNLCAWSGQSDAQLPHNIANISRILSYKVCLTNLNGNASYILPYIYNGEPCSYASSCTKTQVNLTAAKPLDWNDFEVILDIWYV